MKKALTILAVILLIAIFAVVAVACGNSGNDEKQEAEVKTYTIQYTDNAGTHTITVEAGAVYSISEIPTKEGYTFMGLFDAETGGTKYVAASGASLSGFTDRKDMTLFAQFSPKEYTVELDYQGAPVTGIRELTVAYDSTISALPTNLTKDHATFAGWYTEPECGGTQVADQYGVIPRRAKLTSDNFDLSSDMITLYAGFSPETYTVTFYDDLGRSEEVQVGYNTPIKDVVPDLRKDGMAVLSWSKRQNDVNGEAIFTGKVTDDMVLYSAEWAPVLEFDANGGKAVASIVAKAGSVLSLPTPIRNGYTFTGWYSDEDMRFSETTMPSQSAKLIAHWNAQISFNANGGSAVQTISELANTPIDLPDSERSGFIFAGWYTPNGNLFETTVMPRDSIQLVAKWYKSEKKTFVLIDSSKSVGEWETPPVSTTGSAYHQINLGDLYDSGVKNIKVTVHYNVQYFWYSQHSDNVFYSAMEWYDSSVVNSNNLLWRYQDTFQKFDPEKKTVTLSNTLGLNSKVLYIFRSKGPEYNNISSSYGIKRYNPAYVKWSDFWVEVEYPDLSTLY